MKKNKPWYKKVSNWVTLIACLILVPILCMNLWIIIQSKTNANKVPSIMGYKPFIVLSGSMETAIYKGDLIITKVVDPASLKVDDIIAFRDAEDTVTTHRIIDIADKEDETYFITKGDNNTTQDQNLVELSDVEGLFVLRIPGIGSMMSTLSKPTTVVILVLGITIIFVLGFMVSNKKLIEAERKEFLEYKKSLEKHVEIDDAGETKEVKEEVKKTPSKKKTKK